MKKYYISFITTLFLAGSICCDKYSAATKHYDKAVAFVEQKNWDAAIVESSEAIKLVPNYYEAYLQRGKAYDQKGDYSMANLDYSDALLLDPGKKHKLHNELCILRGNNLFNLGKEQYAGQKYNQAIQMFDMAIELGSNNAELYLLRGNAHHSLSDYDNAISDFSQVIKLEPLNIQAHIGRGNAYQWRSRVYKNYLFASEMGMLSFWLEDQPTRTKEFVMATPKDGIKTMAAQDWNRAISDLSLAIKLEPNSDDAYVTRGDAYVLHGNDNSATMDYNKALKLNPNNDKALSGVTLVYTGQAVKYTMDGNYSSAITVLNEAIKRNPNSDSAYFQRGLAYGSMGENNRAILDFNEAIRLNSNNHDYYHNRGISYAQQGNIARAITDYNEAIKRNQRDAKTYYHRGLAYGQIGDINRANADFSKARQLGMVFK